MTLVSNSALAAAVIVESSSPSRPPATEGPAATRFLAILAEGRLCAAALTALFLWDAKYRAVAEARGNRKVRALLDAFRPSVTILNGAWSADRTPTTVGVWEGAGRVLLLLDPEDAAAVFRQAVNANARGYVSRSASRQTLEAAVSALRSSGWYLDPLLTGRILLAIRQSGSEVSVSPGLSKREDDILIRIASGRSTKEIAREYAIAPKTVSNHVNNIYRKLNLTHRCQLVLYAAEKHLTAS